MSIPIRSSIIRAVAILQRCTVVLLLHLLYIPFEYRCMLCKIEQRSYLKYKLC